MSRTDLDPATFARMLRRMAGDGSIEWVMEPIQAAALLDIADLLAENVKLREQIHWLKQGDTLHVLTDQEYIDQCERERLMQVSIDALDKENARLREYITRLEQANIVLDSDNCDLRNDMKDMQFFIAENRKLRELAQRADRLLTDLFPHIDYSRCTALEAVAAWRVRARELGVEVD